MKILTPLVCICSILLAQTALNAEGLYKWKDARGNTQYGDRPPANSNAQAIDLPKITVIEKYAEQWKPMKFDQSQAVRTEKTTQNKRPVSAYTKLSFLAPKANQAIRANDGDVSAMISIKPPLKKGHNIVFSIDGKATKKGKSRTQNFSGLGRGSHTIGVMVVNANGKPLKTSSVSFNVLRFSQTGGDASKLPKLKTYNDVKKEQQGQ